MSNPQREIEISIFNNETLSMTENSTQFRLSFHKLLNVDIKYMCLINKKPYYQHDKKQALFLYTNAFYGNVKKNMRQQVNYMR